MKLLESTSPIVRGKAFLVVLEVVRNSQDMLLLCCQSRYNQIPPIFPLFLFLSSPAPQPPSYLLNSFVPTSSFSFPSPSLLCYNLWSLLLKILLTIIETLHLCTNIAIYTINTNKLWAVLKCKETNLCAILFLNTALLYTFRLVMYIERDTRKQTMGKSDMQHMDYLSRCLELLIANLIDMVPNISSRSLISLHGT